MPQLPRSLGNFDGIGKMDRPARTALIVTLMILAAGFAPLFAQAPMPAVRTTERPVFNRFVPIEDLEALLLREPRGILLPRAEYDALVAKARANQRLRPRDDVTAVIARTEYSGRIEEHHLKLTITATIRSFRPEWTRLVLGLKNVSLLTATLDDEVARIAREPEDGLVLLTNFEGQRMLRLEATAPLASLGSDRVTAFGLIPSAAGQFAVTVPPAQRLLVDERLPERPAPIDQPADYVVAVGARPELRLRLSDKRLESDADALMFASTAYAVRAAPGEVAWQASSHLEVFGQKLDQLTFEVAETLEVAAVESPGLDRWELLDSPDTPGRTRILLHFGQPFQGSRQVVVTGTLPVADQTDWAVPALTLLGATSHVGALQVSFSNDLRLRERLVDGARRLGDTSASDGKPGLETWVYQLFRADFDLRLSTEIRELSLQSAVASVLGVSADGLTLETMLQVSPVNRPLLALDLAISADWELLRVTRQDQPVVWRHAAAEAGRQHVHIELPGPIPPGQPAEFRLSFRQSPDDWPPEPGSPAVVALPVLTVARTDLMETALSVRSEAEFQLLPENLSGIRPSPLQADWEQLRFESDQLTYNGSLQIARRPPRLTLESIVFARQDRTTNSLWQGLAVNVAGGGIRTLEFLVPEALGETVRFTSLSGQRLVEQTVVGLEEGRFRYRVRFADRMQGRLWIGVDSRIPREAGAGEWKLPLIVLRDVERQTGFLAVEAAPDQRVSVDARDAEGNPLLAADRLELPPVPYSPEERLIAIYRLLGDGIAVTLTDERFERAGLPSAVVTRLELESNLSKEGNILTRAAYRLYLTGVQSLQFTLPEETKLWSVLLDGRAVDVRTSESAHQIAVPSVDDPLAVRELQIYYSQNLGRLPVSGWVQQSPPELSTVNSAGKTGTVEILDQKWTIHHQPDTVVDASRGRLEPQGTLLAVSWWQQFWTTWRPPSVEAMGGRATIAIVTAAVIFLLVVGLRRAGWQGFFANGLGVGVLILLLAVGLSLTYFKGMVGLRPAGEMASTSLADSDFAFASPQPKSVEELAAMDESAPTLTPYPSSRFSYPNGGTIAGLSAAPSAPTPAIPSDPFSDSGAMGGVPARAFAPAPAEGLPTPGEAGGAMFGVGPTENRASGNIAFDAPQAAAPPAPAESVPQVPTLDQIPYVSRLGDRPRSSGGVDRNANGIEQPLSEATPVRAEPALAALGLLPLAIELTPPVGSLRTTFSYHGSASTDGGQAPLEIHVIDSHWLVQTRWLLIAAGALIGWWVRRFRAAWRYATALLVLLLSLAVLPHVELTTFQVIAEGCFAGALAAIAAWWLHGFCSTLARLIALTRSRTVSTGLVGLILLGLGLPLDAQEPASEKAMAADAGRPPAAGLPVPGIRVYDNIDDPLAASRVYLPRDEFLRLYRQAHPDADRRPAPPTSQGVLQALYVAELRPGLEKAEALADVKCRFVIDRVASASEWVDLPLRNPTVASVTSDQGAVNLATSANGIARVHLPKLGLHVVDVVLVVPARLSGEAGQLKLPILPSATGRVSFAIPVANAALRVDGSTTVYRRVESDGKNWIELGVDRLEEPTIVWQPAAADQSDQALVQLTSNSLLHVEPAGFLLEQTLQYRVRRGSVAELALTLPSGWRVKSVGGSDVGGWEAGDDNQARPLKIFLRRLVNDATELRLELFLAAEPLGTRRQTATIELPIAANVTSETGQLGLFADNSLSVAAVPRSALTEIPAADFPSSTSRSVPNPARLAWRQSRGEAKLELTYSRRAPRLKISAQHGLLVTPRRQDVSSHLVWEISESPLARLEIGLPRDLNPIDVSCDVARDWFLTEDDSGRILSIELTNPLVGSVQATVRCRRSGTPETLGEMLLPTLPPADQIDQGLAVWIDSSLSASVSSSGGWRASDIAQVAPRLLQLQSAPPDFGFQSLRIGPDPVELALSRKPSRLRSSSLYTVDVTNAGAVLGLAVQWDIDGAPVDVLHLRGPGHLAGRLEFDGPRLRAVNERVIDAQTVEWALELRTPVTGRYFATAAAALPVAASQILLPQLTTGRLAEDVWQPLERQAAYVMLINSSEGELIPLDPGAFEPVARDEVPIVIREELANQSVLIARIRAGGDAPGWRVARAGQLVNLPAAINLADLVTVVARDGSYRGSATYTIKNRTRQFLALRFPEALTLDSVHVGGNSARAVETAVAGKKTWLIALPKTSAVDLAFAIQVVWSGRSGVALPEASDLAARELSFPAPQVIGQAESEEFGIPIARTRWTIYLPEDVSATPVSDPSRHNLTSLASRGADDSEQSAILAEMQDQLSVLGSSKAAWMKSRAMYNYRQMKDQLQSTQGRRDLSKEQELDVLYEKVEAEARQSYELQSPNNSSGDGAMAAGQQAWDDYSAAFGRVISNNGILTSDNESGVTFQLDSDSDGLKVLGEDTKPADAVTEEKLRRKANERAELGAKSESANRSMLRQQNTTALESLKAAADQDDKADKAESLARQAPADERQLGGVGEGFGGARGAVGRQQHGSSWSFFARENTLSQQITDFDVPENAPVALGTQVASKEGRVVGLSLPFEFPRAGREILFTKTGGDPSLTLSVAARSRPTHLLSLGLSLAIGIGAILLLLTGRRWATSRGLAITAGLLGSAVGILIGSLPVAMVAWIGFVVFVIAACAYGVPARTKTA